MRFQRSIEIQFVKVIGTYLLMQAEIEAVTSHDELTFKKEIN